MMTTEEFCRRLAEDCAVQPGARVLVAVSGGADSVALLCFFCETAKQMDLSLFCAHAEHGIRGEASREDMAFVQALCREKGIPFYGAQLDVPARARESGLGIEATARALRYDFLDKTAKIVCADVIATAHHALDQAETVLLHLARGSDVRGLGAMKMRRGRIIRPLLHESPQALRDYLCSIGQTWREDASNADIAYARNRVRRNILPELEKINPGAVQALCRTAEASARDEDYFAKTIRALRIPVYPLVNGCALEREQLSGLHDALLGRVLVRACEMGGLPLPDSVQVAQMMRMLREESASAVNLPEDAHARLEAERLYLVRDELRAETIFLNPEGETKTPFGVFSVRPARHGETGNGKDAQVFPAKCLAGACVRGVWQGGGMIPFGRRSEVPFKKLLTDAGIGRAAKASVPVVEQGDTALWMVGIRPSAHAKVIDGEAAVWVGFTPGEIQYI